jgi:diguanylate cyclase (GGDEF)-like protein
MNDTSDVEHMNKKQTPLWVSKAILLGAAILFSFIGIATLTVADQSIEDSNWVSHTQEVISQLEDLQTIYLTAESSMRGHIISGNPQYKDVFDQSVEQLPGKIESLKILVSDNPAQVLNIEQVRDLITKRLSQIKATFNAFQEGGIDNARLIIQKNTSAANFDLKKEFLLVITIEQHLLLERKAASVKSYNLLKIISISGIPLGLLMVLLVYVLLSRELKGRTIAEQHAIFANNELASTVEKLGETSNDLKSLSDYGSYLQSCKTFDEAVEITTKIISKLTPNSSGCIYLMKASKNIMERTAQWGLNSGDTPQNISPSECWCIRRSKPNFSDIDSYTPPCTHIHEKMVPGQAWLCLELTSQGNQLGLITIHGTSLDLQERFSVIEAAMEQLSLSLSSLQLRNVLEYQSTRDDLTGLYNRRYMDESFRQLHARSTRHSEPYSLLMLDVDHFKNFNDIYGHEGGDIVLREIGKILTSLRAEDIACRYGGEEISIALPDTEQKLAIDIANRLREKIHNTRIDFNNSPMTPITVSIGIASFPSDGKNSDDILKKADAALYQAKREGRNRVIAYIGQSDY